MDLREPGLGVLCFCCSQPRMNYNNDIIVISVMAHKLFWEVTRPLWVLCMHGNVNPHGLIHIAAAFNANTYCATRFPQLVASSKIFSAKRHADHPSIFFLLTPAWPTENPGSPHKHHITSQLALAALTICIFIALLDLFNTKY